MENKYFNNYVELFQKMTVSNDKKTVIDGIVKKINSGKERYQKLQAATSVPWFVIGVIHYMEASCDFTKHLHNGDPLSAKTKQVPAGRPLTGNAPFTFEESAIDALKLQKLDKVTDWNVGNVLFILEGYNGFGYRTKGINSPYLWSFSNLYSKGKYVADGKYDANAISKQAGAGVILKRVMEVNNLLTVTVAAGGSLLLLVTAFFF